MPVIRPAIKIMLAIDVETALVNANADAVTAGLDMIDTTGYVGIAGSGKELRTECRAGDTLVWTIRPLSPTNTVTITEISGAAVADQIFRNLRQGQVNGVPYWTAVILHRGPFEIHPGRLIAKYRLSLHLDGHAQTYDPLVVVTHALP